MKRLLILSVFVVGYALTAVPAAAEQPADASGDWTYLPVFDPLGHPAQPAT